MNFLEANEGAIRLAVFVGSFVLFAFLETLCPRKARELPRLHRWVSNWALTITYTLLMRALVPVLAVGFASQMATSGWGVLNLVSLPYWFEIMVAFVLLDLLIYAQHVATHHIPLLWRIHKVHHTDRDMDVTTALRFHPLEIIVSLAYKLACIALLGPAAIAVLLFEVALNASAMFNHANIALPAAADKALRRLIITPDMHRAHHSTIMRETNSNFGFFLSFWDRLFRTYTDTPEAGHDGVVIGLGEHQDIRPTSFLWCLILPFMHSPHKAPVSGADKSGRK